MSTRPKWLRAAAIAVLAPMYCSRFETRPMVCAPSAVSFPLTSYTSSERSTRATAPPSRAALVATASPRPCAAPVTTRVLPSKRPGKIISTRAPRLFDPRAHRRLGVIVVLGNDRPQGLEVAVLERLDDLDVVLRDVAHQVDRRREHLPHVLLHQQLAVRLEQDIVRGGRDREQVEGRVGLAESGGVGEVAVLDELARGLGQPPVLGKLLAREPAHDEL